jgi:hypothetical protein
MAPKVEKALLKLREQTGELTARLALTAYADTQSEQRQAIHHFLNRALQIGMACDFLCGPSLEVPLTILMRVMCEDLILCFWIARSERDAAEYCRAVDGESLRLVRIMLENSRGEIRHKSTKEDKTAEVLAQLKGMSTDGFKIEQLAAKMGLQKLYDIVYRWPSLRVHGKSFGPHWRDKNDEGMFASIFGGFVPGRGHRFSSG